MSKINRWIASSGLGLMLIVGAGCTSSQNTNASKAIYTAALAVQASAQIANKGCPDACIIKSSEDRLTTGMSLNLVMNSLRLAQAALEAGDASTVSEKLDDANENLDKITSQIELEQ